MDFFHYIIEGANNFFWGYFLIVALIGVGLYFTIRSKFVQFSYFKEMFKALVDKPNNTEGKHSISSFQAFCISVASRVGTGNLAGVATAIALGGYSAVFWMWIIALVGSATSFVESTLAQAYKSHEGRNYIGGPAYYMQKGLGSRGMGIAFSIVTVITFGLIFNTVQTNTIALSLQSSFGFNTLIVGIVLMVMTAIVIFGGVERIAKVSSIVVPFMAIAYILLALVIMAINIDKIPALFTEIFANAFGFRQMAAGALGAGIMQGIRRGLFSNEAGVGSAPNAAAVADVSHPVKQGFVQMLGVFTDTLVICSSTAFIVLLSGAPLDGSVRGIALTQMAIDNFLGNNFGSYFISVAIFFFAFSSVIGNYYYGEVNIRFVTHNKGWLFAYRVAVVLMVLIGTISSLDIVWQLADLSMAVMTTLNLVAIVLLSKIAFKILGDYSVQHKAGVKNPIFRPSKVEGLPVKGMEVWDE